MMNKTELSQIISAYKHPDLELNEYFQVGPDTWIYLFHDDDQKYILISTDYLGDYEFDHYPQLLRFDNFEFTQADFVLQYKILPSDVAQAGNTALFVYS